MAKYDDGALQWQANWYRIRAFVTIFFHTACGVAVAIAIAQFQALIQQATVVGMIGRHFVPVTPENNPLAGLCIFLGFAVGIGKALTYMTRAQEMMCLAEIEKHLRKIGNGSVAGGHE